MNRRLDERVTNWPLRITAPKRKPAAAAATHTAYYTVIWRPVNRPESEMDEREIEPPEKC